MKSNRSLTASEARLRTAEAALTSTEDELRGVLATARAVPGRGLDECVADFLEGCRQHILYEVAEAEGEEAARRRNKDPRINIQTGDACNLQFADGQFDRALSLLVLHFVAEPKRAVAEMRRVVRPGGVAAATVWDNYGGQPSIRLFWDIAATLDAEIFQQLQSTFLRLRRSDASQDLRHRDVLPSVQERQQIMRLEDESDLFEPQPAQISGSIATESPSGEMAEVGQTSRQRVQPVCRARECAQREASKRM